jgi:S-adenosylmethionine synthetase
LPCSLIAAIGTQARLNVSPAHGLDLGFSSVPSVIISALSADQGEVEVVERKGLGHPDTICDALAETLSRNLCREYRTRFGDILHHNVDKALLCGGSAAPAFGGGTVRAPINIYLAGRAVTALGEEALPINEIAVEGSRAWLRANLHALDADRHVQLHSLIRPGSQDLQALFSRGSPARAPLANDTSFGIGYAPMSLLERLVLAAETRINMRDRRSSHPAWGEDIKVMGVRCGADVRLTVACAMIGKHLAHIDDYLGERAAVAALVREVAVEHGFPRCSVDVNLADDPQKGSVYLTVTGTSAEAGDDGQVGRGNRINGLITPYRPMTLEAAAGKNPVTHVGKLYSVLARQIAEALVHSEPDIVAAQCLLLGQIGAPLTEPALMHIRLATADARPVAQFERRAEELARARLARVSDLVDDFVTGTAEVF